MVNAWTPRQLHQAQNRRNQQNMSQQRLQQFLQNQGVQVPEGAWDNQRMRNMLRPGYKGAGSHGPQWAKDAQAAYSNLRGQMPGGQMTQAGRDWQTGYNNRSYGKGPMRSSQPGKGPVRTSQPYGGGVGINPKAQPGYQNPMYQVMQQPQNGGGGGTIQPPAWMNGPAGQNPYTQLSPFRNPGQMPPGFGGGYGGSGQMPPGFGGGYGGYGNFQRPDFSQKQHMAPGGPVYQGPPLSYGGGYGGNQIVGGGYNTTSPGFGGGYGSWGGQPAMYGNQGGWGSFNQQPYNYVQRYGQRMY